MKSSWMPALALRIAIYGLIVPLGFVVVVPHSFDLIEWLLTRPDPFRTSAEQTVSNAPIQTHAVAPLPDTAHVTIASPPLPTLHELFAEAERIHDLFDQGRMHELYASFSDEAKAQVPEDVFVIQAGEVLEQLGPRKPDGWDDANWISTLLNGRSTGRKVLLWKLHPDTLKFDIGSMRHGSLSDASEDLVLDVSGAQIKLAMFSEFKAQPPAASIWLPRTCPHPGEDPLRHCAVPGKPANVELQIQAPR